MIDGINKNKSEKSYREIIMDSSSSLKDFATDRKKYKKKYILNEIVEEEDSLATITGRVVETLLFEPELFDERFYLSVCTKAPSAGMLDFVNALYKHTLEATDEKGNVTREFSDLCKDAYIDSGYKIALEAVLKKFIGTDNELYYREMREVKSRGLTVVTVNDVSNSEKIVEELKTNFVTEGIINLKNSGRWEVINQFQIEGYEVDGHSFKSMLDKIIADNLEKILYPKDLKCTWSVERFYEEYYLKRLSHIQAYLYYRALVWLTQQKGHKWYGYKVAPLDFIVCDSINYYNPLIYTLSESDMEDAYYGFEHKGRKYKGVKSLIEELQWCQKNDIWGITMNNYMNKGIVNIKG